MSIVNLVGHKQNGCRSIAQRYPTRSIVSVLLRLLAFLLRQSKESKTMGATGRDTPFFGPISWSKNHEGEVHDKVNRRAARSGKER